MRIGITSDNRLVLLVGVVFGVLGHWGLLGEAYTLGNKQKCEMEGRCLGGQMSLSFKTSSYDVCLMKCRNRLKCQWVTFYPDSRRCILYITCPSVGSANAVQQVEENVDKDYDDYVDENEEECYTSHKDCPLEIKLHRRWPSGYKLAFSEAWKTNAAVALVMMAAAVAGIYLYNRYVTSKAGKKSSTNELYSSDKDA